MISVNHRVRGRFLDEQNVLLRVLLAAGILLTVACGGQSDVTPGPDGSPASPGSRAAQPQAEFVGRTSCVACHADEDSRWQGSHHDLAMRLPSPDTVRGDFDGSAFTEHGVTTRFNRRDDEYWITAEGPTGEPEEYRVAYTFGVEPLQQYLLEFEGGRFQALDVAWDSRPEDEGGQRWFHLQPSDRYGPGDPLHWTGVAYNWNYMCAECHSTDVRKNYDLGTDSYATTFAEVNVACEACHGPASNHIAWAEAREDGAGTATELDAAAMGFTFTLPRLNDHSWSIDETTGLATRVPAAAPAADVQLCGRCHARRGMVQEGFRAGAPVSDFYRVALLDQGLYHDDGQILDEVFVYGSFLQSRMYQQGVGCGDCHEPHSLQLYNEGNALCSRCHANAVFDAPDHHRHEQGSEAAACVSCHMPASTYMVVDPRRDHSFRVPRPDMTVAFGTPNACADCHADQSAVWAAEAVQQWFGPDRTEYPGQLLASARSGSPRAGLDLRTLAADPEAPAISRATALAGLPLAGQADVSIISAALGDPHPLVRRGALQSLEGADPATVRRLTTPLLNDADRSVRLEAARTMASLPAQQIPPSERAGVQRAIDEYVASQQVNADRAQAHLNLGWVALQRGDIAAAEVAYRTALDLEPSYLPTFINLADLYRATGRDAEGEALLRRALDVAPESAEANYSLGLLLVRQDRLGEAVEALQRARDLGPGDPHYAYVYAVGVQTAGDTPAALTILDDALQRFPTDRELLFGAAAFSRDGGELDRAIGYAQRLVDANPEDPQAIAFLRELQLLRRLP